MNDVRKEEWEQFGSSVYAVGQDDELCDCITNELALHIVRLHNESLRKEKEE